MATLKELRQVRIEKLNKLKELGIDPYTARSYRDTDVADVLQKFDDLENSIVTVAGRVTSLRKHGKLVFIDLKDMSGTVQLYIKQDNLPSTEAADVKISEISFENIDLLDLGDFVEVTGAVTKTQRGEISVEAQKLRLLTKSLRPMADKWDGLKDIETRMRRRYVDTNVNKDVFDRFVRRAKFWEAHREFFKQNGFLEINIPVLEPIPGGADATPFVTHMEAIDQDFFLRISHELYLKRLIGGGYEKVFEIGPRFRNEGLSDEHLPEHIAMEFYWAYADLEKGMKFAEEMFKFVINKVYDGKMVFEIRGHTVDFSKEWEIIDFKEIMQERFGIDIYNTTLEEVSVQLEKHNVKKDFDLNLARGIDNLWKSIRGEIAGPAFLINHPKFLSPLSKSRVDNPQVTERCQPIIAGSELGNGWSELNDPLDQLERFEGQQKLRDQGDDEAQWLDIDYVEMLEYGMPPTFGWGHSERVFWFLEDVTAREGVPFPQLKFELDEVTKDIYGIDEETIFGKDFTEKTSKKAKDTQTLADNSVETANETTNVLETKIDPNEDLSGLPTREQALEILKEHVKDEYQILHSKMIATSLEAYAKKLGENQDLWYITGLLHDVDYFEHPQEHPKKSMEWFLEWNYPSQLGHAVAAHAWDRTGVQPKTKLAAALIACDELSGLIYAYSLMRPEGLKGMKVKSLKKKFKDKSFAAKVNRDEVNFGVEKFEVDMGEHMQFLIEVYQGMEELTT